ncbi:MAG TPA: hypothetical protein VFH70_09515 [Acidimicrobiales bacterium]|nr:hypothetical protein [Acidimicrobiales bacterium]
MRDLTCDEVNDSAAGYALDILEPEARDSVAAHIERCRICRDTVTRTRASADELLDIRNPPWEDQVWPDFPDGEMVAVRPARRRLRLALTMTAVMVLMVGTTLGPEIEQAAAPRQTPTVSAVLVSGEHQVGSVEIYAGRPTMIRVQALSLGPTTGRIRCELVDATGKVVSLGQFRLDQGRAGWAAPEPAGMGGLSTVMLVDGGGHLVATASFAGAFT